MLCHRLGGVHCSVLHGSYRYNKLVTTVIVAYMSAFGRMSAQCSM